MKRNSSLTSMEQPDTQEVSHELLTRTRESNQLENSSLNSVKISKSLWSSTEYKIYIAIIVFGLVKMFYTTIEFSSGENGNRS